MRGAVRWLDRASVALARELTTKPVATLHVVAILALVCGPILAYPYVSLVRPAFAAWIGVAIWTLLLYVARRRILSFGPRYHAAFLAGDADAVDEWRELIVAVRGDSREATTLAAMLRGDAMLLKQEWAAARDALAQVERRLLPGPMMRALHANNLAYATARAGEPEKALAIVERALGETRLQPSDEVGAVVPSLRGTHGITLALAGKHDEAIGLLEEALAAGRSARAKNEHAFVLATSYRAVGRTDDAARTFAIAAENEGPFAEEARRALTERSPFRA